MYEHDGTSEKSVVNILKQAIFIGVHVLALGVFFVGFSWIALAMCLALYVVRMFAITGAYHRYFSHRSYQTSRAFQFFLAWLGASSGQKGPIWWASHHRHHHKHSDTPEDIHPPRIYGLWWAHVGWVLSSQYLNPRPELVRDLTKIPEIAWVDRNHWLPPLVLGVLVWLFGLTLEVYFPGLGVTSWQMLIWGFFLSTALLYHGTFCINSVAHLMGTQRFKTGDDSRNSFLLSLVTLGEGWHNNHHRYPGAESQGMYWWEIDITHYILKSLSFVGLVWDLRGHPERIYQEAEGSLPAAE